MPDVLISTLRLPDRLQRTPALDGQAGGAYGLLVHTVAVHAGLLAYRMLRLLNRPP